MSEEKEEVLQPSEEKQAEDEQLFRAIEKKKKKKRKRVRRIVIIVIIIAALAITGAVIYGKRRVREEFASNDNEMTAYTVQTGSISTSVSGSGTLSNVDAETLTLPAGVEVEELMVSAYDTVNEGDVIATVNLDTVMTAMADVQSEIDDLDDELADAADDTVSSTITAGVAGRIKKIYASAGDDVANTIYENGALAVISLDGYMALDLSTDKLSAGDTVSVIRPDGKTLEGSVESAAAGKAVVLVTDNGPEFGEQVTVTDEEGNYIGSGELYVHSPLRVTGITGTVSRVYVKENASVRAGTYLFALKDTDYSADYDALLVERNDREEELLELVRLYRDGALYAPFSGSVTSVEWSETDSYTSGETDIVTLAPDVSMSVTISVDESDILSLEPGQTASVTVSSISSDSFAGTVTEINKTATSSSGVTKYTAVITLDKDSKMLSGMSASVVIRIEGVDDALIVPVDAVHQTSSTSYVYTSYNEETGEPGGMTIVTTGLSNSSYIEITEGLSEGDTVYYTEEETFSFGGMSFGGGSSGEMPSGDFGGMSGGEMPSGDFGGMGGGEMPSGGMGGGRDSGSGGRP